MLRIEIEKRADGTGLLRCQRSDGSLAWQRQTATSSAHFALHDLTHYAVETVLGYEAGFFGLIGNGWEIEDTQGKSPRGPLPAEALEVERLVGLFDTERASGMTWSAEAFNAFSPRLLTEEQLRCVRECRDELFRRWSAVGTGDRLVLQFPQPH